MELTVSEKSELEQHETIIRRGLDTFVEVGAALLAIRDGKLYRALCGTFEQYCRERWGMSRIHAHRLIEAAEVMEDLLPIGNTLPANEAQARPLASVPSEARVEVWQRAVESAPNGKVTATHVERVVSEFTAQPYKHVSDDSYEWYTPAEYIEAARRVMGKIDLDPASSHEAQKVVKAKAYLTKEDDGLAHDWRGKVFINPPYCHPEVEHFCDKAIQHYQNGEAPEAVVLINNATDAAYFHRLLEVAGAVCFTRGRVKYWGPHAAGNGARQGQAIFYMGPKVGDFASEFGELGTVLVRYDD